MAIAQPAHDNVFANPQQHHIGNTVTVNIKPIGARDVLKFQPGFFGHEFQALTLHAGVAVECCRVFTPGQKHVRETVGIAVKCRNATAHHEFPGPGVGTCDTAGFGFIKIARNHQGFPAKGVGSQEGHTNK